MKWGDLLVLVVLVCSLRGGAALIERWVAEREEANDFARFSPIGRVSDPDRVALAEANTAEDEFLGIVSHELRAPVTMIQGGTKLLRDRFDSLSTEDVRGLVFEIAAQALKLRTLVEDLLAFAKTNTGGEIEVEPVDVLPILTALVKAFSEEHPSRPIEAEAPSHLAPAMAESTYVKQIIGNLLSNADKYAPPDLPVQLAAWVKGDEFYIDVRDFGPGVPAEELDRIFESFYRSSLTSGQKPGEGLGLTVCKRLIEAMGGRIWAALPEGGGLEVTVTLPVAREGIDSPRGVRPNDAATAGASHFDIPNL